MTITIPSPQRLFAQTDSFWISKIDEGVLITPKSSVVSLLGFTAEEFSELGSVFRLAVREMNRLKGRAVASGWGYKAEIVPPTEDGNVMVIKVLPVEASADDLDLRYDLSNVPVEKALEELLSRAFGHKNVAVMWDADGEARYLLVGNNVLFSRTSQFVYEGKQMFELIDKCSPDASAASLNEGLAALTELFKKRDAAGMKLKTATFEPPPVKEAPVVVYGKVIAMNMDGGALEGAHLSIEVPSTKYPWRAQHTEGALSGCKAVWSLPLRGKSGDLPWERAGELFNKPIRITIEVDPDAKY